MKRHLLFLSVILALLVTSSGAEEPLRIFIRGGKKSHGPNAHEHERFLNDWKKLLAERGAKTDGALDWPTAEQLRNTDVLVMYAQDGGNATPEQKANLADFTKRGGGLVIIHTAAVSNDPVWWKSVIGGSWVQGKTKWREGLMDLYYVENERLADQHPITKGASNFRIDDEIYYDMDIAPEVRVLATSYTPNVPAGKKVAEGGKPNIYDIQPQMWTYEKDNYRAFVTIPGHLYFTFEKPHYRAILLRGIAWAGKRSNIDELCTHEEIASLTYPEGGPQRPADTLKALEIHPDFTLKLIASEPLINKPMNFDWDPAGRMWVAETPEYPNGRRGMRPDYRGKEWKDHGGLVPAPGVQDRPAHDRISILTDTDGDGVMDKKEVFYEGLDLVTGLVFYKDGVIVTQAPDILWLRDTNGDGKADKVEKLYTGLGTMDTHAVINNPRWGWDGWIYATHGYSASNNVVNAKGEKQGNIGSGVVRFLPDGSRIEQYSSKGGNTWGLEITGDNRVMWTQPTSGDLLMHTVLPEYALARGKMSKSSASFAVVEKSPKAFPLMSWEQMAYVQIDLVGSFTAAAGCVIYDGGAWPEEYTGDYFTTEPTINVVHHTRLSPQGSSYTYHKLPGREEMEFIRSKDMWWRPIEVRVGPDGAIYIADFYNQAVIHNDTRGPDHNRVNAAVRPDRDHYFGRIWRLDHKSAKKLTVPDLSKAGTDELMAQLENPNRPIRMTAHRLLAEKAQSDDAQTRQNLGGNLGERFRTGSSRMSADAKVATLWTSYRIGGMTSAVLSSAFSDQNPAVRRNAALIAEELNRVFWVTVNDPSKSPEQKAKAQQLSPLGLVGDPDAQVRVAALRALAANGSGPGQFSDSGDSARFILLAWPKFDDDFQRSAAIGALSLDPVTAIAEALKSADPASLAPVITQLAQLVAARDDSAPASKLVIGLADKPAAADALKRSILDMLSKSKADPPAMTPQLSTALGKLLASGASGSVLPLAAKWDKAGALKSEIERLTAGLFAKLESGPDDQRLAAAEALIGLRGANPNALPAVIKMAMGKIAPNFQRQLIVALGETADPNAISGLAANFAKFAPEAQNAAFEVLLKRPEAAVALLEAAKNKQVDLTALGPANVARLRTHPDKQVANRANAVLDELFGPQIKAKNETLAKLTPVVEQPGNAANGKMLFTAVCSTCHKLGDLGMEVGPPLTGMGAHGPSELLLHIVDPNREVEPSYVAWNIETKDGAFHTGVIARENNTSVLLKNIGGLQDEVKVAEIKSRVNTGRSLMPEGLEALGGEALRDILTFICGEDARFRIIDLHTVATADSRQGLFQSPDNKNETIRFREFGNLKVRDVPFAVNDPARTGRNLVVLKGGGPGSYAWRTWPQRVDIPVPKVKANVLHFLSGVGGWAYPFGDKNTNLVALRVIVNFEDGGNETIEFKNGVEFADYISRNEVDGSTFVGLSEGSQIRYIRRPLAKTGTITSLVLESGGNQVAPVVAAITAELVDAKAAAEGQSAGGSKAADSRSAIDCRVLLVGGGSSHDFARWFGEADKQILSALKPASIEYTEDAAALPTKLREANVLLLSSNQPINSETRKALIDFANAGKGIIPFHPGTWYAWPDFPQWNREIVGGGTRGHDKYGEFEVVVVDANHPITAGLPPKFKISDELYNFIPDSGGTPIKVLAQATSPITGKTFPQVWVTQHPKARIACITLGHDAKAHELPEFQTLLRNAVRWVAGK